MSAVTPGGRSRGIGRAIVIPAAGILVALLVGLGGAAWFRLSDEAERVETTRAQITAHSLAASDEVAMAISPGDSGLVDAASRLVEATLKRDAQVLFVSVARPKGTLINRFSDDDEGRVLAANPNALTGLLGRSAVGEIDLIVALGEPAYSGISTPDAVDIPMPGKPYGKVFVGVSLRSERAARRRLLATLLATGLLALLGYIAAMVAVVRRVSQRMRRVVAGARAVHDGDLTARVGDATPDELGAVGRAFDDATARVGRIVSRISEVAEALKTTGGRIAAAAQSVRSGAAAQRIEADSSSKVAAEIAAALAEIARRAEAAQGDARAGAGATARISTVANGVARGVEEAEAALDGAADGVATISRSITDVAGRAAEVSGAAASTSSAILELNATIHRVRETAEAAARLAEHAGGDAERGQNALSDTVEGIDRIRVASRAVSDVTVALERRAREIGLVLQLVGDLTERTNLLALNASIIAAQAGVEGRGFAVVAAEIKDLARRTASSAGEIAGLVAGIEEDAGAARRAAEVGAASVEEGSDRARATASALSEIFNRVRDSAQLSLSIATATDEQVRASAHVAEAMNQVTSSVEQIARATSDQSRQGEQVAALMARLRGLIRTVAEAIREQRDGARDVAGSVEALKGSVEQVAAAQRARAGDGARLRDAFSQIRAVAASHEGAVLALDAAVAELQSKAQALAGELELLHT